MDLPSGFICFQNSDDFILALVYCQEGNFDVSDFAVFGFHYIVVFNQIDLQLLHVFCQENNLSVVCYQQY